MEDKDRRRLLANCDKLVKEINWPQIFPKLIDHGIYHSGQKYVQQWMKDFNNHDADHGREIYLKIPKRGPEAFDKFVECLKEIDRNDLANILKPENSSDQVDNNHRNNAIAEVNGNNNSELNNESGKDEGDDYWKILQETRTPLKIVVKKATKFTETYSDGVPCYTMRSKPRGLVLIINNTSFGNEYDERQAAKHDESNLIELFEQMGFSVQTSPNLTRQEMLDRIETFSKQPELRKVHSTFVIVMSHGNEHVVGNRSQSVVCGTDNQYITDAEVLDFFSTEACENMYNKPKIFIFQTCRGEKVQQAVNASNISLGRDETDVNKFVSPSEPMELATIRSVSDMLVAYCTLPGHKGHRDKLTGSWYIQTLCEVLMNHAHNTELTRMFQMADQRLSTMQNGRNGCQTSIFSSWGFNKQCYLNPGYFES